jgi:hypothetical protein
MAIFIMPADDINRTMSRPGSLPVAPIVLPAATPATCSGESD